jgi:hypothetical protein
MASSMFRIRVSRSVVSEIMCGRFTNRLTWREIAALYRLTVLGLGMTLNAMYDFHAQHGIEPKRGHGRHDANGSVIRWRFSESAIAEAFASVTRHLARTLIPSTIYPRNKSM